MSPARLTIALTLTFLAVLAPLGTATAQDFQDRELSGLAGFELLTLYANPYDPSPQDQKQKLAEDARAKIAAAGLPIMDRVLAQKLAGRPRLLLLIGVLPEPFCGPSKLYEIEVTFQEDFQRIREPQVSARKDVWTRHFNYLSTSPEVDGPEMIENAVYVLDHFIESYREANP